MNVGIIGCGVSGLSCGIRLLERGYGATIIARDLPPHTTSNIAAAIWYPYKAYPEDKVLRWSADTFQVFLDLLREPAAGITMTTLFEPFMQEMPDPWWQAAVASFRRMTPAELPDGFRDGFVSEVPVIETPLYMTYLLDRFQSAGGRVEQRAVADLAQEAVGKRVLINCAGLAARELVDDESLYPIRGQIVRVAAVPGVRALLDNNASRQLSYIVPRRDGVVLGGTDQVGDWNETIDEETAAAIYDRCLELEPGLAGAGVLEHLVGLRPGRPQVRLEQELIGGGTVLVHNYGHGGAGFTLSWGCADEVANLVETAVG